MCGIAGFFTPLGLHVDEPEAQLRQLNQTLQHRGPDDAGVWHDQEQGIGLAHTRLSILDLSAEGQQPKTSPSKRYVISYNGEIYNTSSLTQQLGHAPQGGHSDTAVLLEALDAWGVEAALPKFTGMFAIAIWDHQEHTLWLVRDQLGIKPLYVGWVHGCLWFGSELGIMNAIPNLSPTLNLDAVGLLLKRNVIGGEHGIVQDWKKVKPGHALSFKRDEASLQDPEAHREKLNASLQDHKTPLKAHPTASKTNSASIKKHQLSSKEHCFWDVKARILNSLQHPFQGDYEQAVTTLEQKLSESIQQHMASDVPLGAFLSGGIDSSLICALAQRHSSSPLKTFTIGFKEANYNEAHHAADIAKHLKTDHHELYLDADAMISAVETILDHAHEPFADSSLIPTSLVSKMTREHVTVSLSGDGGDELFCGYPRFNWTQNLWDQLSKLPHPLRPFIKKILTSCSPQRWNAMFKACEPVWKMPEREMGQKLHRLAGMLHCRSAQDLYSCIASHLHEPSDWTQHPQSASTLLDGDSWRDLPTLKEQMMFADTVGYLPDDILTKVDRASMEHSLESRVPLLTPELVEFAWSLPLAWREEKRILKDVLYRHVPRRLMERPKMGFGIPISEWLAGPLKPWVEMQLDPKRIAREGIFKPAPLAKLWHDHQHQKGDYGYVLWDFCCFQHWLKRHPEVEIPRRKV